MVHNLKEKVMELIYNLPVKYHQTGKLISSGGMRRINPMQGIMNIIPTFGHWV